MGYGVLKYKVEDGTYKNFELTNAITTLGRSRSNDIVIEDSSLSRLHIRLENRNGRYFVMDNNSSNGTFLNRRKITEAPLKDGDTLITGRVMFFFNQVEDDDDGKTKALPLVEGVDYPAPANTIAMNIPGSAFPAAQQVLAGDETPPNPTNSPAAAFETLRNQATRDMGPALHAAVPESLAGAEKTAPSPVAPPPLPEIAHPPIPAAVPTPQVGSRQVELPRMGTQIEGVAASHLSRLLAFILDGGIGVALYIPAVLWVAVIGNNFIGGLLFFLGFLAAIAHVIVGWLKFGKTLGKHLMGIRIVDTNAPERPGLSPKALFLRLLGYCICAFPMYLGFLYIFFNDEALGIQDKIAGTRVIKA